MNIYQLIKLGQKYLQLWPEKSSLEAYFTEYRTVKLGRLVYRYFPSLAIVSLFVQLYFGSWTFLPQAVMYSVFIVSMPIQMLIMFGVKADKTLPPSLALWYKEAVAKVNQKGGFIKLSVHKPKYIDLAYLLKLSAQQAKY